MELYVKEITKLFPKATITKNENHFNIGTPDFSVNIILDSDLQKFKKNLQKMLKTKGKNSCGICFEKYKYSFFCDECFNNICLSCFNKIRIKDRGEIVCPFCRHTRAYKIWDEFELKLYICKHNVESLKQYYENKSIMLPAMIYIKYNFDNKNFVFDSGGIFEEIDEKMSDKCKYSILNRFSFYYDVLADLFDNPIFEKATKN